MSLGATRYFHRIGAQRGQGVDLLGHPHGADFGGHGGANAARHHEAGQDRPEFAGDRPHHDVGDGALGGEAGEAGVTLQGQDHAGEERRQADHGQREIADLHHLA